MNSWVTTLRASTDRLRYDDSASSEAASKPDAASAFKRNSVISRPDLSTKASLRVCALNLIRPCPLGFPVREKERASGRQFLSYPSECVYGETTVSLRILCAFPADLFRSGHED